MDIECNSLCTVHLGYLQLLLDYLRQNGHDPAAIFDADLLTELTQVDPNTRRPIEEWDHMMALAERHANGVDVALKLAEFVKPWDTGPIGFLTMACRTLQEATEALAQFYNLLNDVYTLEGSVQSGQFLICLTPIGPIQSTRLERLTLATIAWHARWLSRQPDLKFDVVFRFPAPSSEQLHVYQKTFGGSLTFDGVETCLQGPAEYAGYLVSKDTHGVDDVLRAQLMAEMASLNEASGSFVHKLERILKPRLESGQVSLEDVAAEAGVSIRTLQNRLDESGLSYRTLLDRMRRAQAELYLGNADIALIEVAQRLGFATQSSFHHAFKRWSGMPPGEYRRQKLRPTSS
ncbi:MAG: AraC family transcriptional regulator ligand-binding domain-containing protein [Pseudomonadota bacterium]